MKKLLVLALLLAALLALKLLLAPLPRRPVSTVVPLIRKSAEVPPAPKRVRPVPSPSLAHRR